jgi:hypothetical protein
VSYPISQAGATSVYLAVSPAVAGTIRVLAPNVPSVISPITENGHPFSVNEHHFLEIHADILLVINSLVSCVLAAHMQLVTFAS